jgi:UDP-glucose 4-epimerase
VRILVTGNLGFIGGHLVRRLLALGHEVIGVDIREGADICDRDRINDIFEREKPDLVFHLAANTNVPLSVQDPVFDARSLQGALNVIDKRVPLIFMSSAFVYGNTPNLPTKEVEPFYLSAPYGIVKHTIEQYLKFYGEVYGLPYVIVRPSTVYGPSQVKGAMADYMRKLSQGKQAEIYGVKTRDYVYVDDVVDALILLMNKLDGEVYNIGTGVDTLLTDVYYKIAMILGKDNSPILKEERKGEIKSQCLDSSKLRALGWSPKINLDEGLKLCLQEKKQKTTHLG